MALKTGVIALLMTRYCCNSLVGNEIKSIRFLREVLELSVALMQSLYLKRDKGGGTRSVVVAWY